jgi:hypothetical protein
VQPADRIVFINNDASDTVAGTFANLQPLTVLDIGGTKFVALKDAGTGNDVALSINQKPVVGSLTVTPENPMVLQPVTVTVNAIDPDNIGVSVLYDYGDGTSDTTGVHTYLAPGTYTITVTVFDGEPLVLTTTVKVNAGSGTADDDNDGFNNEIEIALGSNPYSAASTPFGMATPVPGPAPKIKRFSVRLNFKLSHKDKISLQAEMPRTAASSAQGQRVIVDVGGVVKSFTPKSRRFIGPNTDDILRLAVRKQVARAFISLDSQNFKPALQDENLTSSTSGSRTVHVVIILNGTRYETDVTKRYKGSDKSGVLR